MKNDFYITLKALVILKIFKFLSWLFCPVEKTAWLKILVGFKSFDIKTRSTSNYNYK